MCGVIALVLGWYQMHRQQRLNEARGLQALEALGEKVHFEISSYRDEPKWLVRLVGRKGFFPLFHSVGTITLHSSPKTADEAFVVACQFQRGQVCGGQSLPGMPRIRQTGFRHALPAPLES